MIFLYAIDFLVHEIHLFSMISLVCLNWNPDDRQQQAVRYQLVCLVTLRLVVLTECGKAGGSYRRL